MIFSTSCEHPRVKEPDGYKRANLIIQAFELVAKQPDETKVTLIHSIDFGWIQDKFVQVDIKRCGQRLVIFLSFKSKLSCSFFLFHVGEPTAINFTLYQSVTT